jgi:hypothetical protein
MDTFQGCKESGKQYLVTPSKKLRLFLLGADKLKKLAIEPIEGNCSLIFIFLDK